jgi:hypothetical protein
MILKNILIGLLTLVTFAVQGQSPSKTSYYKIKAKHSNLYLDVTGQKIYNGDNVAQWQNTENLKINNQKWLFVPVANEKNTYRIVAKHSGLCLDVTGQKTHNGANVAQWQFTGLDNQKWVLEPQGGQYYKIKSKHSNLYLDVSGQKIHNGDNIAIWQETGLENQVWKLEVSDPISIRAEFTKIAKSPPKPETNSKPEEVIETTGIEWVSFLFVQDSWSLPRKAMYSPWYYLEETTEYTVEQGNWFDNYDSKQEINEKYEITTTWNQTDQKSLTQNFSANFSMEASYGMASASASTSISRDVFSSTTTQQGREERAEKPLVVSPCTFYAIYTVYDTITLKRMDGSIVSSWRKADGEKRVTLTNPNCTPKP